MECFDLNESLRPCPFCGARPVTIFNCFVPGTIYGNGLKKIFNAIVKCPKCDTVKKCSSESFDHNTEVPFEKVLFLMDTAIYIWNTREEE
jgi:hypothetical protein